MPLPPAQDPAWGKLVVFWDAQPWESPGYVTISGHDRVIGWDEKGAQGQKGATSERKGEPLKKFKSSFRLTDELQEVGELLISEFEQWDFFEFILARSYDEAPPKALSIYHPDLYRQGIEAAAVKRIGGITLDGTGGGTVEVEWIEFRPPKPTGGGGGVDPDDEPDGRTETDDKIDRALKEIDRLQKEGENL